MSDPKHTPGPWAWGYISDKNNGYVVGVACDLDGKTVSGCVDRDDITDQLLYKSVIGEHEAATCNYADARLIAAAPDLLAALEAAPGPSMLVNRAAHNGEAWAVELVEWFLGSRAAALAKVKP